jgi:hypothetical protein
MKRLIDAYRNFPGEHCGSVAMRGLLHHYCGLDLPEAAVFGLGAGVANVYVTGSDLDPDAILFGRTLTMEVDLATHLGIDYREQAEPDDEEAWRVVRAEILEGRPTMLSGDIFYLDYRDFKVHFPGHRFVLLGFDDEREQVFIADRVRPEPEVCSQAALAISRNPPAGMSTANLWGRFQDTHVGSELPTAAARAIERCVQAMLGDQPGGAGTAIDSSGTSNTPGTSDGLQFVFGVAAAKLFASDVRSWSQRQDASWIARYNASCIEKFGNGGGNFRRLYAGFLSWARELDARLVPEAAPKLAIEAADTWTAVSDALFAASEDEKNPKHWDAAADSALRAAGIEERLFGMLADTSS